MKLVYAVDAIFPPLTGIGRYAWEVGSRLRAAAEIEDIRFISMGRWVQDIEIDLVRKDGTTFPVLVNAVAVYDEQECFVASRGTLVDNT